jgi:ABC-type branched-subunit amino acid transport system substrate-binding protein
MRIQYLLLGAIAIAAPVIGYIAAPVIGYSAPNSERADAVRQIAASVGRVLGAASVCREISPLRIKSMSDTLSDLITVSAINGDESSSIWQAYNQANAEGQRSISTRRQTCVAADRALADLEKTVTPSQAAAPGVAPGQARSLPTVVTPAPAPAPAAPQQARPGAVTTGPALAAAAGASRPATLARGVTDTEIRFGISAPFSGPAKELGRQMKLGIETAFNMVNDAGGIHGRQVKLVATDDGYEPTRTAETMKQLYEKDQVFGIVGNVGTPTAVVALPYALRQRMLFFGAFTGAGLLRRDPPDRYVFNYRASYVEETDAVVRYLVNMRRLRPEQIVVFAQQDSYGDAGFEGVAKAMRALRSGRDGDVVRLNYKRNTIDVDDAVTQLRKLRPAPRAVVMVGTYRAVAKFIEKTRDINPPLIYTNVSFVGSTALAEELMLLGPKYANGVIVTQVVPAVDSYSNIVLEYKSALSTYFPGEAPDYVSLEGYVTANVLIEGLKRTGPQLDTERLVDGLESLRDLDLGLGTMVNFGRTEHQGIHKVWGTQLDANGRYQPIELQ